MNGSTKWNTYNAIDLMKIFLHKPNWFFYLHFHVSHFQSHRNNTDLSFRCHIQLSAIFFCTSALRRTIRVVLTRQSWVSFTTRSSKTLWPNFWRQSGDLCNLRCGYAYEWRCHFCLGPNYQSVRLFCSGIAIRWSIDTKTTRTKVIIKRLLMLNLTPAMSLIPM